MAAYKSGAPTCATPACTVQSKWEILSDLVDGCRLGTTASRDRDLVWVLVVDGHEDNGVGATSLLIVLLSVCRCTSSACGDRRISTLFWFEVVASIGGSSSGDGRGA